MLDAELQSRGINIYEHEASELEEWLTDALREADEVYLQHSAAFKRFAQLEKNAGLRSEEFFSCWASAGALRSLINKRLSKPNCSFRAEELYCSLFEAIPYLPLTSHGPDPSRNFSNVLELRLRVIQDILSSGAHPNWIFAAPLIGVYSRLAMSHGFNFDLSGFAQEVSPWQFFLFCVQQGLMDSKIDTYRRIEPTLLRDTMHSFFEQGADVNMSLQYVHFSTHGLKSGPLSWKLSFSLAPARALLECAESSSPETSLTRPNVERALARQPSRRLIGLCCILRKRLESDEIPFQFRVYPIRMGVTEEESQTIMSLLNPSISTGESICCEHGDACASSEAVEKFYTDNMGALEILDAACVWEVGQTYNAGFTSTYHNYVAHEVCYVRDMGELTQQKPLMVPCDRPEAYAISRSLGSRESVGRLQTL